MSFLNRIFRRNRVECPRCLGKGTVDMEDIKRLKKELFWGPGKCAYCNGTGKVPPNRMEALYIDSEYLTTDLPTSERHKLINGDEDALKRADAFKEIIQKFIGEIEHLYYIENKEPDEIADYLFQNRGRLVYSDAEKQELIVYVEKVIKSKRKS
ncbi:MAG: hypothetical protein ABI480_00285 [Chitinophagaceae bacterium]